MKQNKEKQKDKTRYCKLCRSEREQHLATATELSLFTKVYSGGASWDNHVKETLWSSRDACSLKQFGV